MTFQGILRFNHQTLQETKERNLQLNPAKQHIINKSTGEAAKDFDH